MVAKNLILGITILSFSIGIAAHYNWGNGWGNGYYPQQQQQPNYRPGRQTYYPSQTKFQSTVKLPPGVSVDNAEWVCTSPKTGDMMIIAVEDGPAPSTGGQQPQQTYPRPQNPQPQPIYPQPQPGYPQQPNNPQYQPQTPQQQQQTYPRPPPPQNPQTGYPQQQNNPQYQPQQQNPNNAPQGEPIIQIIQQPTAAPQESNGEGLIDIRMQNK